MTNEKGGTLSPLRYLLLNFCVTFSLRWLLLFQNTYLWVALVSSQRKSSHTRFLPHRIPPTRDSSPRDSPHMDFLPHAIPHKGIPIIQMQRYFLMLIFNILTGTDDLLNKWNNCIPWIKLEKYKLCFYL